MEHLSTVYVYNVLKQMCAWGMCAIYAVYCCISELESQVDRHTVLMLYHRGKSRDGPQARMGRKPRGRGVCTSVHVQGVTVPGGGGPAPAPVSGPVFGVRFMSGPVPVQYRIGLGIR